MTCHPSLSLNSVVTSDEDCNNERLSNTTVAQSRALCWMWQTFGLGFWEILPVFWIGFEQCWMKYWISTSKGHGCYRSEPYFSSSFYPEDWISDTTVTDNLTELVNLVNFSLNQVLGCYKVQNQRLPNIFHRIFKTKTREMFKRARGLSFGLLAVTEGFVQNLASLPTTDCNEPPTICIVCLHILPPCLYLIYLHTYLPQLTHLPTVSYPPTSDICSDS